ncbi:MAG: nuclear transport factor 2 family protein [Thermodesulfobacteriota bacterium]
MATSDLARFFGYVQAFELAWLTDDWAPLGDFFTPDARYVSPGAGPFGAGGSGRDGVVAALRASTRDMDRRFDVRIPEILEGPVSRDGGIWMRYALTLRRAGLPELRMTGDHLVKYHDGRIHELLDTPERGAGERAEAYLREHGARLRPAGAPLATDVAPHDLRDLELAVRKSLVRCYGAAKSQQDADAALAVCSDGFLLETPPFGTSARGKHEARAQLALFFSVFPDYRVTVDGMSAEGDAVACWGTAHLTFAGPFLDVAPTGRSAEVPFVSVFTCDSAAIGGERFYFDLGTLCRQIGVPVEVLQRTLGMLDGAEYHAVPVAAAGA